MEYVRLLTPELERQGVGYRILDLSDHQRQFQLSLGELRELGAAWGVVVSFDHGKWIPRANEVRLPHGIRPNLGWSHSASHLFLPSGRQRYAAIGLPSHESIAEMVTMHPALDPSKLHLVGDLRADRFLANLRPGDSSTLGVFSGWRDASLVPALGTKAIDLIASVMVDQNCETASLTVHPRVRHRSDWRKFEREIDHVDWINLVVENDWEQAFGNCAAFLGDKHTSMFDLLAMSGRPTLAHDERDPPVDTQAQPEWSVGLAARESTSIIKKQVEDASH